MSTQHCDYLPKIKKNKKGENDRSRRGKEYVYDQRERPTERVDRVMWGLYEREYIEEEKHGKREKGEVRGKGQKHRYALLVSGGDGSQGRWGRTGKQTML